MIYTHKDNRLRIIRGMTNLPLFPEGCVLTIGNFDSVHRGHQAILEQLVDESHNRHLPSVVMVFEPQPGEFFLGKKAPVRLTHFRGKAEVFRRFNIDFVFVIPFRARFSSLTPDQFIQQYLVEGLNTKFLIVGDDFHFGMNHAGNFEYLNRVSAKYGFLVEESKTRYLSDFTAIDFHKRRISSTWVREAILGNDFKTVEQLLGHPYTICGRVSHGDKRGRLLGFPTANIFLKHDISSVLGIYVVKVRGVGARPLSAVASVGNRPTFGGKQIVLEVFILDFDQEIYGRRICVEFLHKLRDELKFDSAEALVARMKQDVEEAKIFLALC